MFRPEIESDGRVAVFALGTALVTALIFGLAPALTASRSAVASVMKASGPGVALGRARLRSGFVASQVAMSMLLLVTAVLLPKSQGR